MCKVCTGTRGKGVVTGSPTYIYSWKFNGLAAENLAGPQKESNYRLPTIIIFGVM